MDLLHRMVLEDWLQEMFRRFDAIASHLLPTAKALSVQSKAAASSPGRPASKRGAAINVDNIL